MKCSGRGLSDILSGRLPIENEKNLTKRRNVCQNCRSPGLDSKLGSLNYEAQRSATFMTPHIKLQDVLSMKQVQFYSPMYFCVGAMNPCPNCHIVRTPIPPVDVPF